MFEKPTAHQALGIEYDDRIMKCATLTNQRGRPKFEGYSLFALSENGLPKDELSRISKADLIATALPPGEVINRSLEVKLKKIKDIDAVLAFQAEPLLPYSIDQALLDRVIVSETNDGTQLTIFAVRKDHLQQSLEFWKTKNIEPEIVGSLANALALFSNSFYKGDGLHFVLHFGLEYFSCALVKDGALLSSLSLRSGINQLEQAYAKDVAEPDLSKVDFSEPLTPQLAQAFETLRMDVTRSIFSLEKAAKGSEIQAILVTGEDGALKKFSPTLGNKLPYPLVYPMPMSGFEDLPTPNLQRLAAPIGLALSGLHYSKNQVNFRQQEYTYPRPWKRLITPLATYFGLAFLAAIAFYFFSASYIAKQTDERKVQFIDLLASMHKSYPDFEKEFAAKNPSQKPMPIEQLSVEDLSARVQFLEDQVRAAPQVIALFPNTPRVSDVLAWLSSHPNVVAQEGPDKGKALLQIDNLIYTMAKRPELTRPREHYQVKVEVEFSSLTPKQAREFHDVLIAPNDFVDPKSEVKWTSSRGKYRASFFLKDRTQYPT